MIQEKRGMLKIWNVSLILGAGTLAILGTFLVRSGILDSIHAFGASTLGIPFVVLLAVMLCGVGLARALAAGPAPLRGAARLAAVPRGRVPVPEPGAGGDGVRDLLGHVLPADLRGGHRHQGVRRPAGVPAVHRAARAGAGGAGRDRPDHRLAARHGREPAAQLRAAGDGRVRHVGGAAGGRRRRLASVRARDVRVRHVRRGQRGPGVRARRGGAAGDDPRVAAGGARCGWSAATAGATAATSCTSAWRCC